MREHSRMPARWPNRSAPASASPPALPWWLLCPLPRTRRPLAALMPAGTPACKYINVAASPCGMSWLRNCACRGPQCSHTIRSRMVGIQALAHRLCCPCACVRICGRVSALRRELGLLRRGRVALTAIDTQNSSICIPIARVRCLTWRDQLQGRSPGRIQAYNV